MRRQPSEIPIFPRPSAATRELAPPAGSWFIILQVNRSCSPDVEDLTYQSLEQIEIDAIEATVDIEYSEADQGGTKLRLRFKIPRDRHQMIVVRSGYVHEGALKPQKSLAWSELPPRIGKDLLPWLAAQRLIARASEKQSLDRFLADVEHALAV